MDDHLQVAFPFLTAHTVALLVPVTSAAFRNDVTEHVLRLHSLELSPLKYEKGFK